MTSIYVYSVCGTDESTSATYLYSGGTGYFGHVTIRALLVLVRFASSLGPQYARTDVSGSEGSKKGILNLFFVL
jgi:hypothetical protein